MVGSGVPSALVATPLKTASSSYLTAVAAGTHVSFAVATGTAPAFALDFVRISGSWP